MAGGISVVGRFGGGGCGLEVTGTEYPEYIRGLVRQAIKQR